MIPHIPNDPVMLLSYINTQLRDHYAALEELCASLDVSQTLVTEKLGSIGYKYDRVTNQFTS